MVEGIKERKKYFQQFYIFIKFISLSKKSDSGLKKCLKNHELAIYLIVWMSKLDFKSWSDSGTHVTWLEMIAICHFH